MMPSHPVVSALVTAINNGDRDGFLALLTPDAVLTDDGSERDLTDWIDREIFNANGHMAIQREKDGGLDLLATFRNDTWGEMNTKWTFHLANSGSRIDRIDTGQA